jgi:hypothetical protein
MGVCQRRHPARWQQPTAATRALIMGTLSTIVTLGHPPLTMKVRSDGRSEGKEKYYYPCTGRGRKDEMEQPMTGTSQLIPQEKGEAAAIHKPCMRSCGAGQGP